MVHNNMDHIVISNLLYRSALFVQIAIKIMKMFLYFILWPIIYGFDRCPYRPRIHFCTTRWPPSGRSLDPNGRTHSEAIMNPSDCPKQLLANLTQKWFVGWIRKVGCVFSIVDVSIPPHAEFGPNEHREGAPQFMTTHI